MPPEEIVTNSAEETMKFGRALAVRLQAPILVLLKGDLGAGKTTLTKGIISGLGAAREEDVTSPTFNLVHVFKTQSTPPGWPSISVRPGARQTARGGSAASVSAWPTTSSKAPRTGWSPTWIASGPRRRRR